MNQLDDFLEPKPVEEPPADSEVIEEEKGEEKKEEAAPPAVEPPDVAGLKAALLAERQKRQAYEEELARKTEEESKRQQNPEDIDEYKESIKAELRGEFQKTLMVERLNMSEAMARDKHSDFDEKLEVFKGMVQENPALYTQMVQQANPAEFAYKQASQQLKMKEFADPEAYEKALRDKIRAELEAEYKGKGKSREELPVSLAGTRGVSGTKQVEWQGPSPLGDILK